LKETAVIACPIFKMQLLRTHVECTIGEEIVLPHLGSTLSVTDDRIAIALTALTRFTDKNCVKIWSSEGETRSRYRIVLFNIEWGKCTPEAGKVMY
jgi:hypothetical protein